MLQPYKAKVDSHGLPEIISATLVNVALVTFVLAGLSTSREGTFRRSRS